MTGSGAAPALHVVVFSNFEGFCRDREEARAVASTFRDLAAAFPEAPWTHLYNPMHLLGPEEHRAAGDELGAWLRGTAAADGRTEIGLHLHAYYALVAALGVGPRGYPHAGGESDCGRPRGLEGSGYDVLLTAYDADERERILVGSIEAFLASGLGRPRTFCAGYSAADPDLQAGLERLGFTASLAGQVVPRGLPGVSYPDCWYELLEWGERLSPLAGPYRVRRRTLLPIDGEPLLERLVEVPLNTDTDDRELRLRGNPVSRRRVIDIHATRVRDEGRSSCVCLGVHDAYLGRSPRRAAVVAELSASLAHLRAVAARGAVPVRYVTASEVSALVHAERRDW